MIVYRLYLARENTYCKRYVLTDIEEAYQIINNLPEYDEYLIIQEDTELKQDEVLAYGKVPKKKKIRKK